MKTKPTKKSIQGQISLKWIEGDRNWLSGPNGIKIDLIRLNRNCLILRENKLSSKNFREKLYIRLIYKIIIYPHASCRSVNTFILIYIKTKTDNRFYINIGYLYGWLLQGGVNNYVKRVRVE